jgi:hypothetical protein
MKGVAAVLAVTLVLTAFVVTVGAADADNGDTAEAAEMAEAVETALEVASDTTLQLVFGAAVGTGTGLLLGSGLTFLYWRRQIG